MSRAVKRGQALALFALTMLLITLMVVLTLSLGSKVRSRMDLQTVADAAAYSDAVATARTMNAMAVMNRVHVAHTVSTIGTLSLISWVTKYWRHAQTARNIWLTQMAVFAAGVVFFCLPPPARPPCPSCIVGVARTGAAAGLLALHANNVENKLERDTVLFQNETTPRWRASQAIFSAQGSMYTTLLTALGGAPGSHAAQLTAEAKLRGSAPLTTAASTNAAELARAVFPEETSRGAQPYHAAQIVMGSRGHPFMPRRSTPFRWTWKLTFPYTFFAGLSWVDGDAVGRGYLDYSNVANPISPPVFGHPGGSWAHDYQDTTRTIMIPLRRNCSFFGLIAFGLGVIGRGTPRAEVGPFHHPGIHSVQHSYQTIPPFYDYTAESLLRPGDNYGQPKMLTVMSKDLSRATDPWDLTPVGSNRGGATFDFNPSDAAQRLELVDREPLGLGNKQVAIGAGLTYYSRPGHSAEPPNMFAPYWRATLTRFTVDRPDPNDGRGAFDTELRGVMTSSGQREAATAYQALERAGYRGFQ